MRHNNASNAQLTQSPALKILARPPHPGPRRLVITDMILGGADTTCFVSADTESLAPPSLRRGRNPYARRTNKPLAPISYSQASGQPSARPATLEPQKLGLHFRRQLLANAAMAASARRLIPACRCPIFVMPE